MKTKEIVNLWGDKYNILPSDRIKLAKDFDEYAKEYHRQHSANQPVSGQLLKLRCVNCGVDELFTKDDYCNCCGAKQISFSNFR